MQTMYIKLVILPMSGVFGLMQDFFDVRPFHNHSHHRHHHKAQKGSKPHILFVLLDDVGWAEVGYHAPKNTGIETPVIDALAHHGVKLERYYTHFYCAPTRMSILSGRAPIHVSTRNDVVGQEGAGIPLNMKTMASVLKQAGYMTHIVGKWHAGASTRAHLPKSRGFDTELVYFGSDNNYYDFTTITKCDGKAVKDLWDNGQPGASLAKAKNGVYEDEIFESRVTTLLQSHDTTKPFFLYWSPHIAHTPEQLPDEYWQKFTNVKDVDGHKRQIRVGMMNYIDGSIGRVIGVMKEKLMYDNALVVVTTDNGGSYAANNYPLKGGKKSQWEGGIRAVGFVTGGILPNSVRGTSQNGYVAAWDWYATFAHLAAVADRDRNAHGLPAIDSLNVWPLLSGHNSTSPRTHIPIGDTMNGDEGGKPTIGGLIRGKWKLVLGNTEGYHMSGSYWTGPIHPNMSFHSDASFYEHRFVRCTKKSKSGCLFNIQSDPSEINNVAASQPQVFDSMINEIEELRTTLYFQEVHPQRNKACEKVRHNGGFWEPFM